MLRTLLAVHIAAGCTALISMFVPMIAKKGGTVHRRAGWVFVSGMTVVAFTALLLTSAAAFAAYGVITGQALFVAFSVIGLVNGATQLAYWLRAPKHAMH